MLIYLYAEGEMNIVIVGLDYKMVRSIANELAKVMQYKFIDLTKRFDRELIENINYPIGLSDDELTEKERELIYLASKKANVVISIPDNMYLSNEGYKFFKNSISIAIKLRKVDDIREKIQNFLSDRVKFVLDEENCEIDKILDLIKERV